MEKRGSKLCDLKAFISDVETERKTWLKSAEESWKEIKKSRKNKQQFGLNPNSPKKNIHYPLWFSTFRIRKPIIYARIPVPIGKDTFGANDPDGRAAAVCLERLARSLMKCHEYNNAMKAARDDYLITDFGTCRAYYEEIEVVEPVVEYVAPTVLSDGTVIYTDTAGEPVDPQLVIQGENGPYIELDGTEVITSERVYLSRVNYQDIYIDPDAKEWGAVRKLAFAHDYTREEYEEIFGKKAVSALSGTSVKEFGKQRSIIRVFEYWDSYSRRVTWFPINGTDTIVPRKLASTISHEDGDLYGLEELFPCVHPLLRNCSTDEFYPHCEFFQHYDLIQEIHLLATRRYTLARALRIRLMYDSTVPQLKELINELGEADCLGVPNLAQSLAAGQGALTNLVQYMPVQEMVAGLRNTTEIFEDRLMRFAQLTGTSDLLQGLTDSVERTLGEQQMKSKYALNQIAEDQANMQEFARANAQLLCEIALKNFSQETLDSHIVPSTLPDTILPRYTIALNMLKSDRKRRFRVELETDSTINLNEQYDKAERADLANIFTTAIERAAEIAKTSPELARVEAKVLRYVLEGYRQGKMFQDDVVNALDAVDAKLAEDAMKPPTPDPALIQAEAQKASAQAEMQKVLAQRDADLGILQNQATKQNMDYDVAIRKEMREQNRLMMDWQQMSQTYEKSLAELQIKYQELRFRREELYAQMERAGESEITKRLRIQMEREVGIMEAQILAMEANTKQYKAQMDSHEKLLEESRLQMEARLDALAKAREAAMPKAQDPKSPVIVNVGQERPMQRMSRAQMDPLGRVVGTQEIEIPLA